MLPEESFMFTHKVNVRSMVKDTTLYSFNSHYLEKNSIENPKHYYKIVLYQNEMISCTNILRNIEMPLFITCFVLLK